MRIAILGNAGAGKTTLARRLAAEHGLPWHEIDRIQWRPGFRLAPAEDYARDHAALIAGAAWVLDGVGTRASIEARLGRATHAVLIDPPLWQNYWLAAGRQAAGALETAPGGYGELPETRALFEMMWKVDRDLMPAIRAMLDEAEARGCEVARIDDVDRIAAFRL